MNFRGLWTHKSSATSLALKVRLRKRSQSVPTVPSSNPNEYVPTTNFFHLHNVISHNQLTIIKSIMKFGSSFHSLKSVSRCPTLQVIPSHLKYGTSKMDHGRLTSLTMNNSFTIPTEHNDLEGFLVCHPPNQRFIQFKTTNVTLKVQHIRVRKPPFLKFGLEKRKILYDFCM